MTEGWVQLHRKIRNWEWYTDVSTCHLFMHLLLLANHKDKKWRGIDIQKGTFITSLKTLSKETGLTVQNIRTSLNKLKSTHELTSTTNNKYTVISITNYNKYQIANTLPNKQLTNNQQTTNKQLTTTNNDNNDNNEKNRGTVVKTPSLKKVGKRLEENFELPDEWGDWAVGKFGWTVEEVTDIAAQFKDYWISKPGKDAAKLDWQATWRNWCRKQKGGF